MSRRFNSIEKITLAATLLAIAVVLGTITKTIRIPHLSFLSFSFFLLIQHFKIPHCGKAAIIPHSTFNLPHL
mgnify:CR=1 FL=1